MKPSTLTISKDDEEQYVARTRGSLVAYFKKMGVPDEFVDELTETYAEFCPVIMKIDTTVVGDLGFTAHPCTVLVDAYDYYEVIMR